MSVSPVFFVPRFGGPPNPHISGADLKAVRRAKGISQTEMAERVGCSRYTMSYWETKAAPFCVRYGFPRRMLAELGISIEPPQNLRVFDPMGRDAQLDALDREVERRLAQERLRIEAKAAKRRFCVVPKPARAAPAVSCQNRESGAANSMAACPPAPKQQRGVKASQRPRDAVGQSGMQKIPRGWPKVLMY